MGRGSGGCYTLRFTNSTDPEPGRCRRTDGKKWRCSRDVAPDQKYCERHMHRGRPRSRKPVERHKNKATVTTTTTSTTKGQANPTTSATAATLPKGFPQSSSLFPKADLKHPFRSMEASKEPRYLDWMKGDTEEMAPSHQWVLMNSNTDMRSSSRAPILQHYEDQLNLNYTDLNSQCCPFLNPDLSSLEEEALADHRETPRSFIDAWSTETPIATTTHDDDDKMCCVSDSRKLPLSTLTLSMPTGIGEGTDQIQMGLGLRDQIVKSQPLCWMTPVSPLGGPLGEVLQSSTPASAPPQHGRSSTGSKSCYAGLIDLMSKSCYGSHEVSPQDSPTRLAMSPSGVLQKPLVSLSDSSSSSSPSFAAASRPEIALQWKNQSK